MGTKGFTHAYLKRTSAVWNISAQESGFTASLVNSVSRSSQKNLAKSSQGVLFSLLPLYNLSAKKNQTEDGQQLAVTSFGKC